MGGEQWSRDAEKAWAAGSSPHGRGTASTSQSTLKKDRFIPAWAGNRWRARSTISSASVHPRMGGEQAIAPNWFCIRNGSSPHGRGTVDLVLIEGLKVRFIPAWAGNRTPS